MSGDSSLSGDQRQALEKVLDQAIRSSQRWQRRFWLLNALWLVAALAAAVIFGYSVFQAERKFNEAQSKINEAQSKINEAQTEIDKLKKEADGQVKRLEKVEKTQGEQVRQQLEVYSNNIRTIDSEFQ